jgi:hypothetical protein
LPWTEEGDLTVVVAIALSLPGLVSGVDEVTVAVLLMIEPGVKLDAALTVRVKTALPTGKDTLEHVTVPGSPTSGALHDQPPGLLKDMNVVPAGRVSDQLAFAAASGPLLVIVIV